MIKLINTVGFIIVNEENKILFLKHLKEIKTDKTKGDELVLAEKNEGNAIDEDWSVLFKTVEEDENLRDIIKKEVKKNLNCEVGNCDYFNLYFYDISDSFIKKTCYFYGTIVGEMKIDSKRLTAKWVNLDKLELEGLKLVPEQRDALNDFINFFQDKFLEKME